MSILVLPGMLHASSYPDIPKNDEGSTWTDKDSDGAAVPIHDSVLSSMRNNHDISWYSFLDLYSEEYTSVKRSAMDPCNILFSSGTTGEPKAIVWSHSTPIKVRQMLVKPSSKCLILLSHKFLFFFRVLLMVTITTISKLEKELRGLQTLDG